MAKYQRAGTIMSERVERLDRSMDIVLVFLTVLSAAIFQFVTALPYDPNSQPEVTLFAFFMRFSLKLMFYPFLAILPLWLAMHIIENENWRMLFRTFVWSIASLNMALDSVAIVVFGFSFTLEPLKYPGSILASIIIVIAFGLALWLDLAVMSAYRRAFAIDPRQPAHDFFAERRWKLASLLIFAAAYLLLIAIIFGALLL